MPGAIKREVIDKYQRKYRYKDGITANNVCTVCCFGRQFLVALCLLLSACSNLEALFNAVKIFYWDDKKLCYIISCPSEI